MDTSKTARSFLGMNAGFSLVTGAALLLAAGTIAELIFAEGADWQTWTLRLLGLGLILFGLDLAFLANDRFVAKSKVLTITFMDLGWILGSIGLVALFGAHFSGSGTTIIVAVALCVAVFALGQFLGARKMERPASDASVRSMGQKLVARVSRAVDAPPEVVWRVMTDHPGYADVADNISKVEVVSGDGLRMKRRCYGPKGENWLETCDIYEDGQAFGFRVHTEAEDYPYPISDLRGLWSVEAEDSQTAFTIHIEATPKGGLLTRTLFKAAAKSKFKAVLIDLAEAWAERMEHEARQP